MLYRREIDGLRAVAVVPVILFHGGFDVFSGGFVGVDVFFVISGYLITTVIISELVKGDFSISRFYERRARRILPGLFFIILACLPFSWLWMPPDLLKQFGLSVVSVVTFVSNILFWKESGYFDTASELKPLIHTWSLSVEEQFYLIFPLFLIASWRLGRSAALFIVILVTFISFFLCEWGWRNEPSANFYLFPTRAWELLVGSICAFATFERTQLSSNRVSLLGLALIISAIFIFDDFTPFPSAYALVPVTGTLLVIMFAAPDTFVNRLLGTKPLVGIGLVSYSAYLWHQPIFAFARLRYLTAPPPELMLGLSALSLGLAYFTWKYIERPFRKGGQGPFPLRRQIFEASTATAAIIFSVGISTYVYEGFPSRFDSEKLFLDKKIHVKNCVRDFESIDSSPCVIGAPAKTKIAVIGDSHAAQWIPALAGSAKNKGWEYHVFAKIACPVSSIVFVYATRGRNYDECTMWRDKVILAASRGKFDAVVLTSSTIGYTKFNYVDLISADEWALGLVETVSKLNKTPVVYITDNPQFRAFDPVHCVKMAIHFGYDPRIRCSIPESSTRDMAARSKEETVLNGKAKIVNFDDAFCERRACTPYKSGILLMRDMNHISVAAALGLEPRFTNAVQGALSGR